MNILDRALGVAVFVVVMGGLGWGVRVVMEPKLSLKPVEIRFIDSQSVVDWWRATSGWSVRIPPADFSFTEQAKKDTILVRIADVTKNASSK